MKLFITTIQTKCKMVRWKDDILLVDSSQIVSFTNIFKLNLSSLGDFVKL